MSLPIAVLVSGSGSNLQALIDKIEAGTLDARISVVLSNKPDAYALERARRAGLAQMYLSPAGYADRPDFDRAMIRAIKDFGAQAVVLAGFMRILSGEFLRAFPDRVVNIHPALLPSFAGSHGQADAAAYGVAISGCTVHFVDEAMDHGPVIIQAAIAAYPDDDGQTLGGRILKLEHRILPQAIQWLAEDRLRIEGRKVRLLASGRQPAALPPGALVNPPLEQGF